MKNPPVCLFWEDTAFFSVVLKPCVNLTKLEGILSIWVRD